MCSITSNADTEAKNASEKGIGSHTRLHVLKLSSASLSPNDRSTPYNSGALYGFRAWSPHPKSKCLFELSIEGMGTFIPLEDKAHGKIDGFNIFC